MNRQKQIGIIRERNAELTKQIDDMRFKLEFNSQLNIEGYKHAKDLIDDLEKIKQNWESTLNDLDKERIKYSKLNHDLQSMKNIMIKMGFKIPWYKKIINKINRF